METGVISRASTQLLPKVSKHFKVRAETPSLGSRVRVWGAAVREPHGETAGAIVVDDEPASRGAWRRGTAASNRGAMLLEP